MGPQDPVHHSLEGRGRPMYPEREDCVLVEFFWVGESSLLPGLHCEGDLPVSLSKIQRDMNQTRPRRSINLSTLGMG